MFRTTHNDKHHLVWWVEAETRTRDRAHRRLKPYARTPTRTGLSRLSRLTKLGLQSESNHHPVWMPRTRRIISGGEGSEQLGARVEAVGDALGDLGFGRVRDDSLNGEGLPPSRDDDAPAPQRALQRHACAHDGSAWMGGAFAARGGVHAAPR
jgi:hypothetical protein